MEKNAELLKVKTKIEVFKEENQGSRNLLDTSQTLAAAKSEYKQRIENLKADEKAGKISLGKKSIKSYLTNIMAGGGSKAPLVRQEENLEGHCLICSFAAVLTCCCT